MKLKILWNLRNLCEKKRKTMNRRNQDIVSDEALVAHLKKEYTYDAKRGVIVNRKLNRVVKGTINGVGYVLTRLRIGGKKPTVNLHHIVWVVLYGRLPTQIDHINGDKTDNHIENLREVSQSENKLNTVYPWRPNEQTGVPGVYKHGNGFRIKNSGRQLYFSDKHEAFHALVLLGRMFNEK